MYNKKIKGFLDNFFEYQKEKNFPSFIGISDNALKKINLVAIEKLTHNSSIDVIDLLNEKDLIHPGGPKMFLRCILNKALLVLVLLPFHLLLLLHKIFNYDKIVVGSSKIIFFGSQSSTISVGYNLLSSIFPNSSFYALTGILGIVHKDSFKSKNTFTGFEANSTSFFSSLKFIFYYVNRFYKLNAFSTVTLKSTTLFLFEYIKVLYSIEKSKLITKETPVESVNIFMCDNNFFHTVHIDRLNSIGCITAVIQHGTFLAGNIVYLPALSTWVLCCSERESHLFGLKSQGAKIHLLGMPLQICLDIKDNENLNKPLLPEAFDLLILGRDGNFWEIENAYKVFEDSTSSYSNKSILIRHHPKSNKEMKKMLESKFSNFTLSVDSSLQQDLSRSTIIISFSVDANILSLLNRKKTIFCGEPEADDLNDFGSNFKNLKVANSQQELENAIQILSRSNIQFDNSYENKMIEVYGDYSVDIIKNNYIDFINQCQNDMSE